MLGDVLRQLPGKLADRGVFSARCSHRLSLAALPVAAVVLVVRRVVFERVSFQVGEGMLLLGRCQGLKPKMGWFALPSVFDKHLY
jgi:hypothetical protein